MIETGPLLIPVFTVLNFHTTTGSLTPFQVQNASWRACRKLHSRIHPVSELKAAIDSQGVNSLLPDPFTEVLQIHLPLSTRFNLPVKHFRAAPVLLRKWYFLTSCAHVVLQVRTQADWGGCCEEPPHPKLIPLGPKTKQHLRSCLCIFHLSMSASSTNRDRQASWLRSGTFSPFIRGKRICGWSGVCDPLWVDPLQALLWHASTADVATHASVLRAALDGLTNQARAQVNFRNGLQLKQNLLLSWPKLSLCMR